MFQVFRSQETKLVKVMVNVLTMFGYAPALRQSPTVFLPQNDAYGDFQRSLYSWLINLEKELLLKTPMGYMG